MARWVIGGTQPLAQEDRSTNSSVRLPRGDRRTKHSTQWNNTHPGLTLIGISIAGSLFVNAGIDRCSVWCWTRDWQAFSCCYSGYRRRLEQSEHRDPDPEPGGMHPRGEATHNTPWAVGSPTPGSPGSRWSLAVTVCVDYERCVCRLREMCV